MATVCTRYTTHPLSGSDERNDPVQTLTLKDGRTLAYANYGAELTTESIPLFYFNGTPGSHIECKLIDEPARNLGIPVIATDRPGFGRSTFQDNRTLLSWPQDVLELADHLSIARFGVIGLSGGGPHALACLHAIPSSRLVAATVVSGMYPFNFSTKGMMWQGNLLFQVAGWSTWAAEKLIDMSMGKMFRGADMTKLIEQVESQAAGLPQPQADKDCIKQVMKDEILCEAYLGSIKEALKTSSKGAAWEMWLFASAWGFEFSDLDANRLTIWHGELDVNVPVGMPDKAHELLPTAVYNRVESEGHVSLIVRHRQAILSDIQGRLSVGQPVTEDRKS